MSEKIKRLGINKGKASTTGIILQIQVFFCKCSAFILLLPEVY
jgi:hypothetical protein